MAASQLNLDALRPLPAAPALPSDTAAPMNDVGDGASMPLAAFPAGGDGAASGVTDSDGAGGDGAPGSHPAPLATRIRGGRVTRREAIGVLGVAAAAPLTARVAAAATGGATTLLHTSGRIELRRGDRAWVLDVRHYDGRPRLDVVREGAATTVRLTGAVFPGTAFPADLRADLHPSGNDLRLHVTRADGFDASALAGDWLAGTAPLGAPVRGTGDVSSPGATVRVALRGAADARYGPDGAWTLRGRRLVRLDAPDARITADGLRIASIGATGDVPVAADPSGDGSLFARPAARRAALDLSDLRDTSAPLAVGDGERWRLDVDAVDGGPVGAVRVETARTRRGALREAVRLDVRDDARPRAVPAPGFQPHGAGTRGTLSDADFAIALERLRIAAIYGPDAAGGAASGTSGSVERAAAADFAPASWLHDAAMTVGLGSGAGSAFRLRSLGLRLVEAGGRPVLLAAAVLPGGAGTIARPVGDGRGTLVDVVSSRRRPSAKRLPSHLHLDARRGASLAFEDQLVAMLRPTDLAVFTFALRNLTVQSRGGSPMLIAGSGAMLGVVLPAQTFGEQAFYRTATLPGGGAGEANPGGETPDAPIKARMAGLSRLVFDVPSGQTIPYTLDGLLEAMRRLSLRVAPNATDASPMQNAFELAGQLSAKPAGQIFAAPGPGGLGQVGLAPLQISPAQLRDMSSGATTPVLAGLALPAALRQATAPAAPGARRTDLTTRLLARSGARVNPQTRVAETAPVQTVAPDVSPRGTGGRLRSAAERSLDATLSARRDVRLLTQTEYGTALGALGDILSLAPPPEPPGKPRAPRVDETALEVPFRLLVSPSQRGAWIHRSTPGASAATSAVELWHTRLGVRTAAGALGRADRDAQRVLTALWYTDPEIGEAQKSQVNNVPASANVPFRMPLDAYDRHNLVHLTSNHDAGSVGSGGGPENLALVIVPGPAKPFKPAPARVRSLMLSSLGAWIDARGSWDARPAALSVSEWVHRGTMGRDHYVKVVYEGALFPTGHRAAVVKVTERSFTAGGMAVLFQRMYLVVRERVRTYGSTSAPALDRVQPLRSATLLTVQTPDLDDPAVSDINNKQKDLFWPRVGGKDVLFSVRFEDVEGETHDVAMPLAFATSTEIDAFGAQVQRLIAGQSASATPLGNLVNAYLVGAPAATGDTSAPYNDRATVAFPQSLVTFAAPDTSGDTTFETSAIRLGALPVEAYPHFVPFALGALVNIPSLQQITGNGAAVVTWNGSYVRDGFPADGAPAPALPANAPPFNRGHVLFDLATPLMADVPAEKSGGFVRPAVAVTAVTRRAGPVGGDVKKVAADTFDPASFFGGLGDAMPKLFGVFKLTDILKAVGMDMSKAPRFLTETMQTVERLLRMGAEFATFAESLAGAAPASPEAALRSAIQAARATAEGIVAQIKAKIDDLAGQVQNAVNGADDAAQAALEGATTAWANGLTGSLGTLATQLTAALNALGTLPVTLPGGVRLEADRRMRQLLGFVEKADRVADLVDQIARFVRIAQAAAEMRVRIEWQPDLADFSLGQWKVFEAKNASGPASLTLAAEFAAQQGSGGPAYDLTCSLDRFTVNLPGPVASLYFDRLFFRACSGRKVEVDCVFGGIEFKGPLSFVERLRSIIPLDGFSDPPYLDVSASGIVAGFTLAIPDLAVGMFAMRNMSFGAELTVPFLGDLTLGLRFCERENPCSVTVMCLGGGFYFGILLGMNGLRLLEAAIEVQASLSINLGIASGSVYAGLGVFFSMEMVGDERHITLMGYFRIGGSVRILGFISISIELRLEMIYKDPPKKMIGRATLEVEVEVFCFSKTFRLEYERKLAGSNDDPTLRHMLATPYKEPVTGATVIGWDEYLAAFA